MPTDAIWIMATVPQKNFEKSIISFCSQLEKIDEHHNDIPSDNGYESSQEKERFMETILLESLEHLHIYDAVWIPTRNNQYYQVYFTTDLDSNDYVIHYLNSMGIGERGNSTLGYMPFSLFYYNEMKENFLKSVTSRLTVAQVVEGLKTGAAITFDYYMYLLFSCTIAAMGLMNSSSIDVAASMLIEPLMGAVMAVSFGLAILNRNLIYTGLKSLFVGLIFCFVFGYIYGIIFLIWRYQWNPPDGMWPTSEMQVRGEYHSLIYGSFIATAGGAVLSVTLLRNNIVALTGVAVATTFMPPFVNGGLCLALATHLQIAGHHQQYHMYFINGVNITLKPAWVPPKNYQVQYFIDMRYECCILASVSFAYTLVNVFGLLVSSYLLLKIKEIAPIRRMIPSDRKFFSEDIRVYREYQSRYSESTNIGQQILSEWAELSGMDRNELLADHPEAKATQVQTLLDIAKDVEADPNYQAITRHAYGNKFQPHLRRRLTQANLREYNVPEIRLSNCTLETTDEKSSKNNIDKWRGDFPPSFSISMSKLTNVRGSTHSVWPRNRSNTISAINIRRRSKASFP